MDAARKAATWIGITLGTMFGLAAVAATVWFVIVLIQFWLALRGLDGGTGGD